VTFWRESSEAVASAVPYYGTPCWYTLDPASLLVTSHFQEGMPEIPNEWLAQEYYEDDVNKLTDVARSERGISTLHEATGGDPTQSPRWHRNIAYGGDQEMIAALRTPRGDVWGALGLYREEGQPVFDDEELAVRVDFFGDAVERILQLDPLTGEVLVEMDAIDVYPAKHFVTSQDKLEAAIADVEEELAERHAWFTERGKLLEAQRLRMRTTYDVEMMRQVGSCSGIENYSRHLDGRAAG
jgi:hypothetical protein